MIGQITSYKDAAAHFSTVRSPSKGKPMKNWCRMFKEGDDYLIKLKKWGFRGEHNYLPFIRITANDTLTFEGPLEEVLEYMHRVTAGLHKVVPIYLMRWKKGVYRVGSEQEMREHMGDRTEIRWFHDGWKWLKSEAPQYFQGIRFNLITGTCLNGEPDASTEVIPEKRKKWLGDLRKYKRGLRTRLKVGALDGYIAQRQIEVDALGRMSWSERNDYFRSMAQVGAKFMATEVVKNMRSETYPPEVLEFFVSRVMYDISVGTVEREMNRLFTEHSEAMRREYGVFGKTLHAKS